MYINHSCTYRYVYIIYLGTEENNHTLIVDKYILIFKTVQSYFCTIAFMKNKIM